MDDDKMQLPDKNNKSTIENLHKSLLDSLRQREQEILQYIAILAPALGGFIWLLAEFYERGNAFVFLIGTVGIVFFLLVGAIYSIALGYSHQCFILQLTKIEKESCLNIQQHILKAWPKNAKDVSEKCLLKIPWCMPPEVIKVFWAGFVVAISGITGVSVYICCVQKVDGCWILLLSGLLAFTLALLAAPIWFGCKIQKVCENEMTQIGKENQ